MKNLLLTSIFLILVLAGGLSYPAFEKRKTLEQEIAMLTTQFDSLSATVKDLGAQESVQNKTGKELLKTIPPVLNQAELIRDISQITKQSKFSFPSIGFSKGIDPATSVSRMTMQFVLTGPIDNVSNFLQKVERNNPFLALDKLQVSRLADNRDTARLSVSLSSLALR